MVAKAREKDVYLGCNLNHYFTPPAEKAKEYINEGRIGEPLYCLHRMGFPGGEPTYKPSAGFRVKDVQVRQHSFNKCEAFGAAAGLRARSVIRRLSRIRHDPRRRQDGRPGHIDDGSYERPGRSIWRNVHRFGAGQSGAGFA